MKPSATTYGAVACFVLFIYHLFTKASLIHYAAHSIPSLLGPSITTVVASQPGEDTAWLRRLFPRWEHEIYIIEGQDRNASLPSDKGLESMTYLTYIIDHYDSLPNVVIFMHGGRYRWHNDDPLYDSARVLSRLQIPYVQEQGYVNMRCVWTVGCPAEIFPAQKGQLDMVAQGGAIPGDVYASAFRELFPEMQMPWRVGASCCAHFAASKSAILSRPREDYERYRRWLIKTELESSIGAKFFEYSWHIIFRQTASHCPGAKQCYCKVFGLCDVPCEAYGSSKLMYELPKYSDVPEGWPWVGWEHEWQNATSIGYIPGEEHIDALPAELW